MRIVFLADSISTQRAGIHYYGRQLIKQVRETYPNHDYSAIVSERLPYLDVEQIIVPISSAIPQHLRLRQMITIPRIINKMNPDMAIELAHFGPFKLKSSIKRVTVIHDLTPITFPQFHGSVSTIMHKRLMPGVINNAASIITNSAHTKAEVNRLYNMDYENIHVLYPKLHKTYHDDQVDEYDNIIHNNNNYILSVGTIEPRKDLSTLIRAFDKIAAKFPSYQLVIAGQSGWKNQTFFETLQTLPSKDRITITGYINRRTLQSLYEHASLYANASIAEGFGLPVLEAMSFGVPLVLSDIPTSIEIAGPVATFFPVGNIDVAAEKLHLALSTLTLETRDHVKYHYSRYNQSELVLPFMT